MTAVSSNIPSPSTSNMEATNSEDVQLPSLSCSDHDGSDFIELAAEDDKVPSHSNAAANKNSNNHSNSRTVSPLLQNSSNSGSNLSFDELHDHDGGWEDEVVILDLDGSSQYGDDGINMEDVLARAEHSNSSQEATQILLLDSDIVMAECVGSQNNRIPFVDDFLVSHNSTDTEADLNLLYSRDFQVPPPNPKSFLVKVVSKDLTCSTATNTSTSNFAYKANEKFPRCTGNNTGKPTGASKFTAANPDECPSSISTAKDGEIATREPTRGSRKRAYPSSVPSTSALEERYRKRLGRLQDSMMASHKTRRSLCMTSPVLLAATNNHDSDRQRRTRVSQVLYSIDCSSYRLDTCFLDPSYFSNKSDGNTDTYSDTDGGASTLLQRSTNTSKSQLSIKTDPTDTVPIGTSTD